MESILPSPNGRFFCSNSGREHWKACHLGRSSLSQTSLRAPVSRKSRVHYLSIALPFDIAENLQQFSDKAEYRGRYHIYTTSPEQKLYPVGNQRSSANQACRRVFRTHGGFFEPKLLMGLSHTTDTAVDVASVSPDVRGYCMTPRRLR